MVNYIELYSKAIKKGQIIAGKWIKLLIKYINEGFEKGLFLFDAAEAERAIKFIETFCHHSEGRSDLLKLELWQKAIVSMIFGIKDRNGNRQFREVIIIIGRKNGKTLFASAIMEYCAFADREYGAKIYCVAPKLDQADLVFSAFKNSVGAEVELNQFVKSRKTDLWIEGSKTSIKKIAFNAKKSDGFNPHLTVCDEVASWPGVTGLKQYEVMKSAMGARKQPLILSLSTAGYEDEGIYDELMKRATRFLLGDSKETRLLPILFLIDDVEKWNDINELKKSNPNLGVSVTEEYLREEIAVAEGSLSKKAEFIVKYCNIKQNSSQAWLPSKAVEKAFSTALNLEDFRGSYCVGGIDLSKTTDLTACGVIIEKNGIKHIFAQFFMPAEKLSEAIARDNVPYDIYVQKGFLKLSGGNFVDYHDCMKWFTDLIEQYQIYPLKVGYDRYCASYLVQDMKTYGFHMDDCWQGENMTPCIKEFEGELKDGLYDAGDNDLLKIHMLNSALKLNAENERVRLIKMGQYKRIDGVAMLLDAIAVKQKYHDEIGEQLKNN